MDIIDIIVGNADPMRVQKHFLCQVPFFAKCLQPGFTEHEERTIRLPEDDPEEVEQLLKHAVSGGEALKKELVQDIQTSYFDRRRDIFAVKLYILANKFGYEDMQNSVVDALRQSYNEVIPLATVFYPLEAAGLQGSKLFAYLTSSMVDSIEGQGWEFMAERPGWNEWIANGGRSVRQVMKKLVSYGGAPDPENMERFICRWHDHVSTPKCRESDEDVNSGDDLADIDDVEGRK